jgi:hypothetical protein
MLNTVYRDQVYIEAVNAFRIAFRVEDKKNPTIYYLTRKKTDNLDKWEWNAGTGQISVYQTDKHGPVIFKENTKYFLAEARHIWETLVEDGWKREN